MKDFPLIRSARAAVIWSAALAIPTLLLSRSVLGGLYLAMILVFLTPIALCVAGLCGGALPMGVGTLAALAVMQMLAGGKGFTLAAVYLLPIVGAFVWIVTRRVPFWKGCAVMIGVHIACFAAAYALLQGWFGGRLYQSAGDAAVSAIEQWEMGDFLLFEMFRGGLIDLTSQQAAELQQSLSAAELFGGGLRLPQEVRKDMLLSVQALVSGRLESLVPGLIASQSILGGVGCLVLPLRLGYVAQEKRQFAAEAGPEDEADATEKRAVDFPDLGMPPLRTWHIPRGIGWQVGAALIAGLVLRNVETPALAVAGMILYAGASAVFTLQGLALLNFMQHMRGRKRVWRVIIPLLLMLTRILSLLGILDQVINLRGLRKPREPKEGL